MSSSARRNPWWPAHRPRTGARLRLFCLPYAGGSGAVYRPWQDSLGARVEVFPAEPPGRGSRMGEPPFKRMGAFVESLDAALEPLADRPFAFYGHSLGALVAFETARKRRREGRREPSALFVGASRAPQLPNTSPPTYELPDAELVEELRRLNGTPPEVLGHAELMRLVLPFLRADFEVEHTYVYKDEPPLGCPVVVFGGLEDREVGREPLEGWREQAAGGFHLHVLPGDHFFLNSAREQLLRHVAHYCEMIPDGGEQ